MTPANGSAPAMDRESAAKEASSLSILAHAFVHENPYRRMHNLYASRAERVHMLAVLGKYVDELANQLSDPGEPHGLDDEFQRPLFPKTDEPLSYEDAEHLALCFLDHLIGRLQDWKGVTSEFREYLQAEHDHNRVMDGGGER